MFFSNQLNGLYDSIQAAKHVSRQNYVKIDVLLYEVPYINSYAEFSGESISSIINAKSSSVLPIFSIFSPANDTEGGFRGFCDGLSFDFPGLFPPSHYHDKESFFLF